MVGLLYLQRTFALSDKEVVVAMGGESLLAIVLRRDLAPAPATDRSQLTDSVAASGSVRKNTCHAILCGCGHNPADDSDEATVPSRPNSRTIVLATNE